mgnify:CR=1 FL=1
MMDRLDKTKRMNALIDAYASLLTKRQRDILSLYYEEDFSLAEIAENLSISRAAVSDHLKRSEHLLKEYEDKLNLLYLHDQRSLIYDKIKALNIEAVNSYIEELEKNEIQEDNMTKIIFYLF